MSTLQIFERKRVALSSGSWPPPTTDIVVASTTRNLPPVAPKDPAVVVLATSRPVILPIDLSIIKTGTGISPRTGGGTSARERHRAGTAISPRTGGGVSDTSIEQTFLVLVDTDVEVLPQFTITGPVTNPTITREESGLSMQIYITLDSDDELVVDHLARTLVLNGTRVYGYQGEFFRVGATNTFVIEVDSYSTGFSVVMEAPSARY